MQILKGFLKSVDNLAKPKIWESSLERIEKENNHLRKLVNRGDVNIYGLNTRPGHRDYEKIELADLVVNQKDLLSSHAIDAGLPSYSKFTARCITFAKLYSWSAGMSGVSPVLFNSLSNLAVEKGFLPKIPKHSSYSSGDVIPASHWATAVLNELSERQGYNAQYGEAMALINGNFVQLGYASSIVKKLRNAWLFFLELCSISCMLSKANRSNLFFFSTSERAFTNAALEYVRERSGDGQKDTQDPISLRAIPQVLDVFSVAIEEYLKEINYLLFKPSGNPLYDVSSDIPLSQASFLSPTLTLKASTIVESILFAMWSMVGRTNYLLSGNVKGVPKDAANEGSSLALIQYPKYMMSILEKSRLDFGRRVYSSGSSTSYGTEDLWTNGLNVLDQVESILDDFIKLGACEFYIFKYIQKHHDDELTRKLSFLRDVHADSNISDISKSVQDYIESRAHTDYEHLFPV
ncbi:aromatic amino acid lyase [Kangiella sp.]|uniref:aromatic amino acid lyase n=1 Tax=Kangiella sp. TaxID=1920245 RepID=UPI0019CE6624|nr:aromatic amino acid lyase [Kangiella sp.]MBD3652338.1 aromatic amino acid lyase [Kangiella sp.]